MSNEDIKNISDSYGGVLGRSGDNDTLENIRVLVIGGMEYTINQSMEGGGRGAAITIVWLPSDEPGSPIAMVVAARTDTRENLVALTKELAEQKAMDEAKEAAKN